MEDLLFKRLQRMSARVDAEVVLQDLWFLDRRVRPMDGPGDEEYRMPFLAESLESRRFFEDSDAIWAAIEVFDDLCELCDVSSYDELSRVLERFQAYRREREPTPVDEP